MDFSLTEAQERLKKEARAFLEKECPESFVREMEEDDQGFSRKLWRKMAKYGVAGTGISRTIWRERGQFL